MARTEDYSRALKLRKQGLSYNQIKNSLGISKSTLSLWLRNLPLTEDQLLKLRVKEKRIETFRNTMKKKREKKLKKYYEYEKNKLKPFTQRDLFIAGLFLYWGEGNKTARHTIGIYNTDPSMIKFALIWLTQSLNIPKDKIRINLHLYSDMNVNREINFWLKELRLNRNQLNKPYIKKSTKKSLTRKGFGHGTCSLTVSNTKIKEHFQMALKATTDHFTENIIKINLHK